MPGGDGVLDDLGRPPPDLVLDGPHLARRERPADEPTELRVTRRVGHQERAERLPVLLGDVGEPHTAPAAEQFGVTADVADVVGAGDREEPGSGCVGTELDRAVEGESRARPELGERGVTLAERLLPERDGRDVDRVDVYVGHARSPGRGRLELPDTIRGNL
ncbi:MAG: hypothetical protein U5R31_15585 [Acidimicrobiia bacterium]|nr:hypothetical protein [Acidimicrobiia bacterium]